MKSHTAWATWLSVVMMLWLLAPLSSLSTAEAATEHRPADDLEIEVTKKGSGKEVVIRRGPREWFLLIEVTPENTIVLRQEKEQETYLVDQSETHDGPMSPSEVDTVITDFINSVKAQVRRK